GARALLKAHPLFPEGRGAASRVAIIGAGATAQHLIVGVARACSTGLTAAGQRLPVTVGDAGRAALSELADRHPEIARFLDLQVTVDPFAALALRPPEVVYVGPDDDTAAISTTLRLRSLLAGRPTRIVAVIAHRAGLALLLDGAPQAAGGPSVATFGLLDEACQPDLLLAGTTELLARALHQVYLDSTGAADVTGGAVAQDTAAERRAWAELPEHLRESNRDQAAHVAVKLAAIGDVIGPLVDWDRAQLAFSPEEVEIMARLEHERWTAERRAAGWRPGLRDSELRTTPFLVPWDELSEELRDRDRVFIRQLPRLLASVGLQALRRDGAARQLPVAAPERDPLAQSFG
ncbi:MAG: RyR domain-containing protein, partial [Candidatus Limnocylindria bacterium]